MNKILVNSDEYNGQYVAIKSVDDNTIIGFGNTPEEALNKAKEKGVTEPFLIYIADKDLVHIYYVG